MSRHDPKSDLPALVNKLSSIVPSAPKLIEAHQVALVAIASAIDLDWDDNRPTVRSDGTWPRFSSKLQDEDSFAENRKRLDDEQIYFQAFVLERCLDTVRTANAGLAQVVFEAWDYYLKNLPAAHGIRFNVDTWLQRRAQYAHAWNDAADRRAAKPDMTKNPFFPIAMCLIEEVCGLEPDALTVAPIALVAAAKANSFTMACDNVLVDRE